MMNKRHLQIRLVKDTDMPDAEPTVPVDLPFIEIQEVVHQIFVGIGALMLLNAAAKIFTNKLS